MGIFANLEKKIDAHRRKKIALLNRASKVEQKGIVKATERNKLRQQLIDAKNKSRSLRQQAFRIKHPNAVVFGKTLGRLEKRVANRTGILARNFIKKQMGSTRRKGRRRSKGFSLTL